MKDTDFSISFEVPQVAGDAEQIRISSTREDNKIHLVVQGLNNREMLSEYWAEAEDSQYRQFLERVLIEPSIYAIPFYEESIHDLKIDGLEKWQIRLLMLFSEESPVCLTDSLKKNLLSLTDYQLEDVGESLLQLEQHNLSHLHAQICEHESKFSDLLLLYSKEKETWDNMINKILTKIDEEEAAPEKDYEEYAKFRRQYPQYFEKCIWNQRAGRNSMAKVILNNRERMVVEFAMNYLDKHGTLPSGKHHISNKHEKLSVIYPDDKLTVSLPHQYPWLD